MPFINYTLHVTAPKNLSRSSMQWYKLYKLYKISIFVYHNSITYLALWKAFFTCKLKLLLNIGFTQWANQGYLLCLMISFRYFLHKFQNICINFMWDEALAELIQHGLSVVFGGHKYRFFMSFTKSLVWQCLWKCSMLRHLKVQ